jgi:hypothetical protein
VPHQVTVASAQGEAKDPGVADDSAGGAQPECLALPVEIGVQATASQLNGSSQWIDLLYRDLEHVEPWTAEAEQGRFELFRVPGYLCGMPSY